MLVNRVTLLWGSVLLALALPAVLLLPSGCGVTPEEGATFIYQVKGGNANPALMDEVVEKVGARLDSAGLSEAEVTTEGKRTVIVKVPHREDAEEAKRCVEEKAQIQFRVVEEERKAGEATGDPDWEVTTEEESLEPEKEIILPFDMDGEEYLLNLGPALLTGSAFAKAQVGELEGEAKVNFTLTAEGTEEFSEMTYENKGKKLAIVFDYRVVSAPLIREQITDGRGEIVGNLTREEAERLAEAVTGSIPAELEPVKEVED